MAIRIFDASLFRGADSRRPAAYHSRRQPPQLFAPTHGPAILPFHQPGARSGKSSGGRSAYGDAAGPFLRIAWDRQRGLTIFARLHATIARPLGSFPAGNAGRLPSRRKPPAPSRPPLPVKQAASRRDGRRDAYRPPGQWYPSRLKVSGPPRTGVIEDPICKCSRLVGNGEVKIAWTV